MEQKLKDLVDEAIVNINDFVFDVEQKDGKLELKYSFYADYRDRLEDSEVADILEADDPGGALHMYLDDSYYNYSREILSQAVDYIEEYIENHYKDSGFSQEERFELWDYLDELVEWDYEEAEEHYLQEEYKCEITIDASKKYTYHRNEGGYDLDLTALEWLAEQQGYSKEELNKALSASEEDAKSPLLRSIKSELANTTSDTNTLTIFVTMPLRELISVNEQVKRGSKDSEVTVSKNAVVGLIDFYEGAGGPLEIQLEKDLAIPVYNIAECLPDAGFKICYNGYTPDEIYGLCGSAWKGRIEELPMPF
ncbi:MAG: hypothetical protein LUE27_06925 [Clostridia bacterium]|nr:hypothetical protein [Clostridia bacterium]